MPKKSLPVVPARKRILAGANELQITDDALLQQLFHFDVVIVVSVLMEYREYRVVLLGGIDQPLC